VREKAEKCKQMDHEQRSHQKIEIRWGDVLNDEYLSHALSGFVYPQQTERTFADCLVL